MAIERGGQSADVAKESCLLFAVIADQFTTMHKRYETTFVSLDDASSGLCWLKKGLDASMRRQASSSGYIANGGSSQIAPTLTDVVSHVSCFAITWTWNPPMASVSALTRTQYNRNRSRTKICRCKPTHSVDFSVSVSLHQSGRINMLVSFSCEGEKP